METMDVRESGDGAAPEAYIKAVHRKYTWTEVRQAVHDLRKELGALSIMTPMSISFRKLSDGRIRIYFLRTPHNGWEITLLYSDVHLSNQCSDARLEWKPLIESSFMLGAATSKYSREEQLLWERQRVAAWGIASYELHAASGRVLFPCVSSLFVCGGEDEPAWQTPPLVPRVLSTGGAPLTPAMCPSLPRLVAHAARGDVWLAGGCGLRAPTRLTYACKGNDRLIDDPRQAGVPCYVTQEEFSRYTGFWWQPHSDDDVFRIVYEEVDESDVKIYSFPSSQSSSGEVEEFRFPRAGTANAKSTLRLVQFKLKQVSSVTVVDYYKETGTSEENWPQSDRECWEVADIRWFDLNRSIQDSFPWCEYIARVGWTPCGNFVWTQILDRKQQRLDLVLIAVGEFSEAFQYMDGPQHRSLDPENLDPLVPVYSKQVLISETAPTAWINVHDILHFLPPDTADGDAQTISFIWASEETGYLHLYLVTCTLHTAKVKKRKLLDMVLEGNSDVIGPQILSKVPLTSGDWEVIGRKIWVDEARKLLYFVALKETPLERHLYAASYAHPAPEQPRLLTAPGESHAVDIDDECNTAVITSSNVSCAPATRVYRIVHDGAAAALLPQATLMPHRAHPESASDSSDCKSWNGSRESSVRRDLGVDDMDNVSEPSPLREPSVALEVPPPQIYKTKLSCGLDAYCTIWRPARHAPGVRYPTVLHVYGGPEVQTVTNSYKGIRQLRMHMLAARGFCVVAVDSRGSKHRGRAWEAAIRGKMGQVELDDQVEVLQWLAKETGCIDMERVAVHGWSYGGYLSLLALATRPNIFKVCVAGAPVTCWRLYDTAYTERYMGLPGLAASAYTRASVLTHATFFPDQEGRLLIIHGLADENVHFAHTGALVSELVRLGKPHALQLYPAERHSLRALHAAKHYEATLLHYLHAHL